MRIIAGRWRGRRLAAPPGDSTRPTADRTRETLFSMLASRLGSFDGLAVVDLYAGSGALGLEALSRGAASCRFVERERAALDVVRANIAALGADMPTQLLGSDAARLPAPGALGGADLLLADPPYGTALTPLLAAWDRAGWIAPGAWIALETARGDTVDPGRLTLDAVRDVGRARLHLLHG